MPVVECPYCSTRYQLDAARLAGPSPMLKCSRCRHIFPAPSSTKQPPAPPSAAHKPAPPDETNLTLPFEEGGWKAEAEAPPADEFTMSEHEEEAFTLGTEPQTDALTVPDLAPEPDTTPVRRTTMDTHEDEDEEEGEPEEHGAAEAVRPPRARRKSQRGASPPERSGIAPIFIFLAFVVVGYGVLTRALFASPALCDRLIGRLPLIGTLGDDRLLMRKVALSDVVGSYQRIKDGKPVYVITGKALNTAPVALHSVQIIGVLYDNAGKALDQKTIYCGNVISAKVLKDLTPQEVSILQKLSPPKRFLIDPGESSTFVIVFMDPPRHSVEFSTQVVGAQRQA